jgi:small subunit ribosomal protein S27Ae
MADGPNAHGKHSKYSVVEAENGKRKLVRRGEFCDECGHGVFLGVHEDRKVCGKCGKTTPCRCQDCVSNQSE